MRILIVDDDEDTRILLASFLSKEGYENVISASSANEAFQALDIENRDPEKKAEADLILMDIIMPGTDGVEGCRQIKKNNLYKDVPIVMVTSRREDEYLVKAFAAGAVDYITKPFNKVELMVRVRSVIKLKEEMDKRKTRERELEKALSDIKVLSGLIPICSHCKKMRNDEGYWQHLEKFIAERSNANFTHGICNECLKKFYPDLADEE
ncbi:MAG: response regulator [Deltaproteobacteria bacterium]|nr:response regulator [Deltaproteobacteria bacterium]